MNRPLVLFLSLFCLGAPASFADGVVFGNLHIAPLYARASNGPNTAAYVTIENKGAADDALLSAKSAASKHVELHDYLVENEVMKMRPVGKIALPVGAQVELKPGGKHIMLMHIHKPLMTGDTITITLHFHKAGLCEVLLKVR